MMTMKTQRVRITPSVAEQALVRVMRVGDRLWRDSDERFARWGLSDSHYNVLRILNGSREPLPQVELGRRMHSSRANVTKLVDGLEQRGFVKRLACPDRRVNLIDLTAQGTEFLRDSLPDILKDVRETMKPLSREEQKTLFRLLGKLLDG